MLLPTEQAERIKEIRRLHWEGLDEALDTLDDDIAKRARIAMARIRKSGYKESVIKRETKRVTAHTADRTASIVAGQIESAAMYAQAANDVIRAWEISGRLKEGAEHLTVSDSALKRAREQGVSRVDAEAALARAKQASLRAPSEQRAARLAAKAAPHTYKGPPTSGTKAMDRLVRAGLVKKSPEIGLSARLHGNAARNVELTEKAIGSAIREAKNMNRAGRDMINAVSQGGSDLAVKRKLTKPLLRLRKASRELQLLSVNKSDPDAMKAATKEFNASFKQIKSIAERRVDSRAGYRETVQRLDVKEQLRRQAEKYGDKAQPYRILKVKKAAYEKATKKQIEEWITREQTGRMDKALNRWLDEKQSYHAQSIVETETSAAYRAREAAQQAGNPAVTGFWWRRSEGMLSLDAKRKKDLFRVRKARRRGKSSKRKTKGRPCTVCPTLADNWYPKSYAEEFPRGAHVLCRCWREWTYDRGKLSNAPITQADVDWYDSLPE
jgi:hypothetical protein